MLASKKCFQTVVLQKHLSMLSSLADWTIAIRYLLDCRAANRIVFSECKTLPQEYKHLPEGANIFDQSYIRYIGYQLVPGIEFKVVTITFKYLHGMALEYVTELLDIYRLPRVLRSAMKLRLCERRANLKSDEGKSFSIVAPKLFNLLPNDLRETTSLTTFKSKLKTFLFRTFYHDIMVDWSCKEQMNFFMRESGL